MQGWTEGFATRGKRCRAGQKLCYVEKVTQGWTEGLLPGVSDAGLERSLLSGGSDAKMDRSFATWRK